MWTGHGRGATRTLVPRLDRGGPRRARPVQGRADLRPAPRSAGGRGVIVERASLAPHLGALELARLRRGRGRGPLVIALGAPRLALAGRSPIPRSRGSSARHDHQAGETARAQHAERYPGRGAAPSRRGHVARSIGARRSLEVFDGHGAPDRRHLVLVRPFASGPRHQRWWSDARVVHCAVRAVFDRTADRLRAYDPAAGTQPTDRTADTPSRYRPGATSSPARAPSGSSLSARARRSRTGEPAP